MPSPANDHRLLWPTETGSRPICEPLLFFRSLVSNPLKIGALAPSSPKLSRLMASCVKPADGSVLEIGAGTGSITKALLETGLNPERLFIIERDPSLVAFLQREFPSVHVCCGDAAHASRLLSEHAMPPVTSVISSLPLRNFAKPDQLQVVRAMMDALADGGQLIQFTYGAGCPVSREQLGLHGECLGRVWMNLPPAAVWRFTLKQPASS